MAELTNLSVFLTNLPHSLAIPLPTKISIERDEKIMTIICAIAFSGADLSAQNNADTIKVSRNRSDTKGIRTFANPAVGLDIARF